MIFQSSNLDDYLTITSVIDWDNPDLQRKTLDITRGLSSDIDKARGLFEWVRDSIPHSKDIDSDLVTCSASEVLKMGTGICYAKSHLFAAMCRFVNIPTGFCYQVYRLDPPEAGTAVHALNAVYLASIAKWLRLDARGNTGNIDAQFDVNEEKLAFPVDPEKGELFIYNTVFSQPATQVVEVLIRYDNRSEMWRHLPQAIDDEYLCHEDRKLNVMLIAF